MYYPDDVIEEVRARNDIVDVISQYVTLKKKGANYFGLCPFHNEKSPSFSVSPGKQMYYCFGCGAGGNVITFIMEYENYSFGEALKYLADRAGITLPEAEDSKEARAQRDLKNTLLEINRLAANYFYYQLKQPQGRPGYEYLKNRRLTDETITHFGLGFANKTPDDLYRYMRSKGYDDSILKETGLFFIEERGARDKFWNRVMFPILDVNNRVIGFGGRVLGDGEPKYLNSPETKLFDKSRNLFGLNFARKSREKYLLICEGYMDVIAMHQAGFSQAVASLGTAFTSGQAVLLKRYANEVLLSYDSDEAGVRAALRAIGILKEAGMTGRVIDLTPYKDPDEFIKNLGAQAFQERLDRAENSFFFELRQKEKEYDLGDPEGKTNFCRTIAKKLCEFSEEVERENYLEAAAQKYHIGFESLRRLVAGYAARTGLVSPVIRPKSGVQKKNTPLENAKRDQRLLLTWLAEQPSLYPKIKKYISPSDFTEELYQKAAERLFAGLEKGEVNPAAVVSMFEEESQQREAASLFHARLVKMDSLAEREKAFHDILYAVKKNSYERDSASGNDSMEDLYRAIEGKKLLEELGKTHISLE